MLAPTTVTPLKIQITNLAYDVERPTFKPGKQTAAAKIHVLAAILADEQGNEGFGYSYSMNADQLIAATTAALQLARLTEGKLGTALQIERIEQAFFGQQSDSASRAAANAISLAAWDLAGKQQGLSCAALWGGIKHQSLPCFIGEFFVDDPPGAAAQRAREYRAQNFRAAKALVGLDTPAKDAQRIATLQKIFPDGVIADPHRKWSPAQGEAFMAALPSPLLWFEDACDYGKISEILASMPLGAGETCGSLEELLQLANDGVTYLLLDLAKMGGPLRFMEASRILNGLGFQTGSHVFPYQSIHLLAIQDQPLRVEMLNWWDPLFIDPPKPDSSGKLPLLGPGFGVKHNNRFILEHGTIIRGNAA